MENNGSEQPIMDVVLRFFREDRWNFQHMEEKPVVRAGFRGEHGTWVCFARIDEQNRCLIFHSTMGMHIPLQYRAAVLEYLNRVNYSLMVGNFEMNFDTGDVRFRTSLEAPEGNIVLSMVRAMAYANVRTMDRYFTGVLSVVHGGLSPEAALARAETQVVES
jgi:hypothetical protein